MQINGKPVVAHGTLVLSAGDNAKLDFAGMSVPVLFKADQGAVRTSFDSATSSLELFNTEGLTLGAHFKAGVTAAGGRAFEINFGLWTIGTPAVARILHFTVV